MRVFLRRASPWIVLAAIVLEAAVAVAQSTAPAVLKTTPSRQTLDEASPPNCEGVSSVIQRCAGKPDDSAAAKSDDPLTRSRAAAKAAFDRRDKNGRDAALQGGPAPEQPSNAQRLEAVTVTGKADEKPSIEEVLQRALALPVVAPNGTASHYDAIGNRYDCVAKCIGPMCCTEVRSMPNPARDSNSIGR